MSKISKENCYPWLSIGFLLVQYQMPITLFVCSWLSANRKANYTFVLINPSRYWNGSILYISVDHNIKHIFYEQIYLLLLYFINITLLWKLVQWKKSDPHISCACFMYLAWSCMYCSDTCQFLTTFVYVSFWRNTKKNRSEFCTYLKLAFFISSEI